MRLPWVSRRYSEELERQLSYRDAALSQMRVERDRAREQAELATDQLILRLGCAPVTPTFRAETAKQDERAEKAARELQEAFAGIDAETQIINEGLVEEIAN